ncbi:hypothetical protein BHE74_00019871 [Ensete ventricosum]|uniref:Uncharacterized protein n=1 Tax=Ensete ventricosum TaxID=4639 RepID=A0A426YRY3_ENSVE|nr:hypothetical protein B296_00031578 [Ensete ventricosum]RWW72315.1 hypothetical protein BHE74_00019871 [Ensete ventricosum]
MSWVHTRRVPRPHWLPHDGTSIVLMDRRGLRCGCLEVGRRGGEEISGDEVPMHMHGQQGQEDVHVYHITMTYFKARYPKLELEDDPFMDYLEDQNILMAIEMLFNDSTD